MPELPEVEVSKRGIQPHVEGQQITQVIVRQGQLRWPVPEAIHRAEGHKIIRVSRRAKYLILHTQAGRIMLHLGMSGSLTVQPHNKPVLKHDHLDIVLDNTLCLRLNDPRRFGACLWWDACDAQHKLLQGLGPEPLTDAFNGEHLYALSRKKQQAVKNFVMDNHVVVGVGNIYASESLFLAGIDPRRAAGNISLGRYQSLADHIKGVLSRAIEQGGTTLKDFLGADGKPGYFKQSLYVYGRKGEPCVVCEAPIQSSTIGQRNSFYCKRCQR